MTAALALPPIRQTRTFDQTFLPVSSSLSAMDKTAKLTKAVMDLTRLILEHQGETAHVQELAKGSRVLSGVRGAIKIPDTAESFFRFIGSCRDKDVLDAFCNFLSIISDGLDAFDYMQAAGAYSLSPQVNTYLSYAANVISMLSLPPLVGKFAKDANHNFKLANGFDRAAESLENAMTAVSVNPKASYQVQVLKYKANVCRDKAIGHTLNAVEKAIIVATVIFAIVAAVLLAVGTGLPALLVGITFSSLAIAAAIFGLARIIRSHAVENKEPKPPVSGDKIDKAALMIEAYGTVKRVGRADDEAVTAGQAVGRIYDKSLEKALSEGQSNEEAIAQAIAEARKYIDEDLSALIPNLDKATAVAKQLGDLNRARRNSAVAVRVVVA